MNNNFARSSHLFNESLKMLSVCPVCHKKFDKINAKIVDETDEAHLIHLNCPHCSGAMLALVFTSGFGATSMGLVTDLSINDLKKYKDLHSVDANDVLEMHQELQKISMFNL
jgi:hypothetical protein